MHWVGFTAKNTAGVCNFRDVLSSLAPELYSPPWHNWVSQSKNPVCGRMQHTWPLSPGIQLFLQWDLLIDSLWYIALSSKDHIECAQLIENYLLSVILTPSPTVGETVESWMMQSDLRHEFQVLILHFILSRALRTLMSSPYLMCTMSVYFRFPTT